MVKKGSKKVQFSDGSVFLSPKEWALVLTRITEEGRSTKNVTVAWVKDILKRAAYKEPEKITKTGIVPKVIRKAETDEARKVKRIKGIAATPEEYLRELKLARGRWAEELKSNPKRFEARQAIKEIDELIAAVEKPKVPTKHITGNITRAIRESIKTHPEYSLRQHAKTLKTSKNYVRNVRKNMVKKDGMKPVWRKRK